jgi:hypothetical protein
MATGVDPRGAEGSQPALPTQTRSTQPSRRLERSIHAFAPAAISGPVFGRRNLLVAGALFFTALFSLWAFQLAFKIHPLGVSNAPHWVYQAESLLHGRWDLDLPASVTDVVVLGGKHYIIYPPFPALLFLPVVALFGLHTSDILLTTLLSAANLSLLFLLFEQARASAFSCRSWLENICFALLLYYGSINLWLSLGGRVWFTAQIVCLSCTLLALLVALRRHFAWSALLLGCAFFCRNTVVWGAPLLFYLAWQDGGREQLVERFVTSLRAHTPQWSLVPWRRLLPPALVMAACIALYLLHNVLLFGSPLESGYTLIIQQRYPQITRGAFSLHYVPANLIAMFFSFPHIIYSAPFDHHPAIDMLDGNGVAISVFVTTPLFLLLFARNRRFSPLRALLWLTLALIVAQLLLYDATGWYQFGHRYLFDGYAYAFLLLVVSDLRMDWRVALLGMIGIAVNLLGAYQFWTGVIVHV